MPCCNCVVIKTIFHKKTNVACKNGLWNCFVSLLTLYLLSIISLFHDTRLFKLTFRVTFRYVASLVQVVFVSLKENIVTYSFAFFLKKCLFSFIFVFQTHIYFTTNRYVKKCPSSIWCWDSNSRPLEHESPSITNRPGLPPMSMCISGFENAPCTIDFYC